MKGFFAKFCAILFLIFGYLNAAQVASIAVLVENEPITDYEINELIKGGVKRADAINMLIRERLEISQIKLLKIEATASDIDAKIAQLAASSNLSPSDFIKIAIKNGNSKDDFRDDIAMLIKKEKLFERIASSGGENITKENAMRFYEANAAAFTGPARFKVVRYSAGERELLASVMQNPMQRTSAVATENLEVSVAQIHPQLLQVLTKTPNATFTPIFGGERGFESYYIISREGSAPQPFEAVEADVVAAMMRGEREIAIANFFNKLRVKANIKYLDSVATDGVKAAKK